MKFQIYGREFKELIDRIGGIVPKRTVLPILQTVKITADGDTLTFQATNCDDYGIIKSRTNIYEDGTVWVYLSDLKKVLGIEDEITVTASEGKFEVRSSKKSYEIPCHDDYADMWIDFPEFKNNDIMCRQYDDEFLNHLSRLNCMRSESETNKMMTAFCIDLTKERIVVLDGHRIGMAHLVGGMFAPNRRCLIVSGFLYNALKSLIGKSKVQNYIEIYADDKIAKFEGEDWTYMTKLVEGQYFNYEKLTDGCRTDYDYIYKFDHKELGKIAKEYGKVVTADNKKPMFFCNNNGRIATGIQVTNYRTSDVVESAVSEAGMDREWFIGVNPKFVSDACNVFNGEVTVKGKYSHKCPIMFFDEIYEVLILPVNITEDDVEFVRKQVA